MKRANCYESRNLPLKLSPSSKERPKGVPFGIPDNSGFRENSLRDWDDFGNGCSSISFGCLACGRSQCSRISLRKYRGQIKQKQKKCGHFGPEISDKKTIVSF